MPKFFLSSDEARESSRPRMRAPSGVGVCVKWMFQKSYLTKNIYRTVYSEQFKQRAVGNCVQKSQRLRFEAHENPKLFIFPRCEQRAVC